MRAPRVASSVLSGSSLRGVVVLGMHRSGTSAATRLVNVLGPATCRPEEMVRGPWNPSGHFESRSLMQLNNAILRQMGCTWWSPPPDGAQYDAVAARITTTHAQARRTFRRVHRDVPWVWKDPRASVLLPFWRRVLGRRVAAVIVYRNPLEVAASMQSRDDTPISFGVALWERYNRLLLAHSQGMPVLVSRYDDVMRDPGGWCQSMRVFLVELGMRLPPRFDLDTARDSVRPELRHSTASRADLEGSAPGALVVYDALEGALGTSPAFVAPPLPPEPSSVATELATIGPDVELAWNPPPRATDREESPAGDTEGRA